MIHTGCVAVILRDSDGGVMAVSVDVVYACPDLPVIRRGRTLKAP